MPAPTVGTVLRHRCAALVLSFVAMATAPHPATAAGPTGVDAAFVVRVYFDDAAMGARLAEWAPWRLDLDKGVALLQVAPGDVAALEAAGFRVEIDEDRTARYGGRARASGQRAGIAGFPCYRTVDETFAAAAALAADHADLARWLDIGDSWERGAPGLAGDDIMLLALGRGTAPAPRPTLMLVGGVHPREYAPPELLLRFAESLLDGYDDDADATWLLDHHDVHIVLQANPDGRRQAEVGQSWRKNTNHNHCGATSSARGADLNRNFPFQWGCCGGSSANACSLTYRGPYAASEPETLALIAHARSVFPDQRSDDLTTPAPADATGVFIDVHSFGEVLLWPWGFTAQDAPNDAGLRSFARKLGFFTGYYAAQALSGATEGTTKDFAYGELGVAAYTLEIGTEFFEDCGAFENRILPDNLPSLLYAARAARSPYLSAAGPDVVDLGLVGGAVAAGTPLTLEALADDTRYGPGGVAEPVQNVAGAEYVIDTAPWQAGAPARALAAADGLFDDSVEAIGGLVDTGGLAEGRHLLYARAVDGAGNWGPVSAAFVHIVDPQTAPRLKGKVLAADTRAPLAADVAAGDFAAASSGVDGSYGFFVVPGNYDLTARPADADYAARTVAGVTASQGQVSEVDLALYPFCDLFDDDVEAGNAGWSADPPWAISSEAYASPGHAWSDSPGGDYADRADVALTSPWFDLTAVSGVSLTFASLCDTEANYDFCIVETQRDGGPWQEAARYDGAAPWQTVVLALPALDGSDQARFRFRLDADTYITADGWHVDDIRLRAAGPACIDGDSDADGVIDGFDNCTLVANADQRDTNADGYGNRCDPDLDDDGAVGFADLALLKERFFGVGDEDSDLDGDGVTGFGDLGIMKAMFFAPPGPAAL